MTGTCVEEVVLELLDSITANSMMIYQNICGLRCLLANLVRRLGRSIIKRTDFHIVIVTVIRQSSIIIAQ